MNVMFTAGIFRAEDDNGNPGVGLKLWAFASPDTATPATTYSNFECTAENPWPIVLNARGEWPVYIKAATDFYLTIPTATGITSPIWESRKVGEQQSTFVSGASTPVTANNNYVVTTIPPVSTLSENFMLIMTPDVTNLDTIVSNTFTGTGINDLTATGPYVGAAPATLTAKIDTGVVDPPGACVAALGAAGALSAGVYTYVITYVNGLGESPVGTASNAITVTVPGTAGRINLTSIPVSPIVNISARKIYRTKAGGSIYYLVTTISDNTTATYTDNIADSALVTVPPTPYTPPACVAALAGLGAGLLTNGVYSYKITFATASGESAPGPASNNVTAVHLSNGQVALTDIPIAAQTVITSRKIYRTRHGGSTYYYVATINDNTTTTYNDNIADASLTVLAPTGSTLPDTFAWKKDGGSPLWNSGVPITGVAQTIIEGMVFKFAVTTGHTLGDLWAIAVMTPARVNLDTLGNFIVYKNKGGTIVPLDGSDLVVGYPAELILNAALNGWLLINPATPTFSVPTISAIRYRKNITSDYVMVPGDEGYELSCVGDIKITMLPCPDFANRFFYVKNNGTGIVTLDAGSYKIFGTSASTCIIGPGGAAQNEANGVDWNIIATTSNYNLVQIAFPAGTGASVTFSGLSYLKRYQLVVNVVYSYAGVDLSVIFNGDSTAVYSWQATALGSATAGYGGGSHTTKIHLNPSGLIAAQAAGLIFVDFAAWPSNPHNVEANARLSYTDPVTGDFISGIASGKYPGAANLNSITFAANAGTITGTVALYEVG